MAGKHPVLFNEHWFFGNSPLKRCIERLAQRHMNAWLSHEQAMQKLIKATD